MRHVPQQMRSLLPFLACLLCALLAWIPAAQAQAPAAALKQPEVDRDASVLVLGRVSDDPKAHYDQLKPLLDYVVPRMASVGIRSGRILMAKDLQQMASYLRRSRVDWVNETAGNAALQRAQFEVRLAVDRAHGAGKLVERRCIDEMHRKGERHAEHHGDHRRPAAPRVVAQLLPGEGGEQRAHDHIVRRGMQLA